MQRKEGTQIAAVGSLLSEWQGTAPTWTQMKTMWAIGVCHNLLVWVALYPFQSDLPGHGLQEGRDRV